MTALELVGLTHRYGRGAPVLRGLDLAVPAGGLTALLGPSGCGKTTALKVVAGLLAADAGDVRFDGESVAGVAPERRGVAAVFQQPLLFPHLSVGDNVGFGLRMAGVGGRERRRQVEAGLELVRLPGLAGRSVRELSGGQAQRVALARALAVRPRVLLLDEPFSQLDAGLRVEVRELVRALQLQLRVTTLFVTHDQEEAVAVADRVALVLDGRVEQHGRPEELYRCPATLRVARFLGARTLLPGARAGGVFRCALGAFPVPGADGPGVLVLRPETLRLGPGPGTAVEGTVVAARYLGTRLEVTVAAGGTELAVTVPPDSPVTVGSGTVVTVPPGSCAVVPPEPAVVPPEPA